MAKVATSKERVNWMERVTPSSLKRMTTENLVVCEIYPMTTEQLVLCDVTHIYNK